MSKPSHMKSSEQCFHDTVATLGLPQEVLSSRATIYEPVAAWLAALQRREARPLVIGVNGAQGSGKSTFCALLAPLLSEVYGLRTVVLSIDDVYQTRKARHELAKRIHPLCAVRGVPGTHDVPMTHDLLDRLTEGVHQSSVAIPRFDKAADDRSPPDAWDVVDGPVDVILFEGWCVGCSSLPEWAAPINRRERSDDSDGVWVKWSRACLYSEYLSLFERLDGLVMLAVPSMQTVVEGRWLQEQRLWSTYEAENSDAVRPPGLMTRSEVEDYVALFERYTRHMLETLPGQADVLLSRGEGFTYTLDRIPGEGT